jgi:hypothetical protein
MESKQHIPTRAVLEAIAAEFGKSLEELALDVHKVAAYCEETGNRGLSTRQLEQQGLPTYFLPPDHKNAYEGILFHNSDEDVDGYQCRKKPHWRDTWNTLYGDLPACVELARDWESIKRTREAQEAEAKRPKRKSEKWARGEWKQFDTHSIGLHYAFAALMGERFEHDWREEFPRGVKADMSRFRLAVWVGVQRELKDELIFRFRLGDLNAKQILHVDEKDLERFRKMDYMSEPEHWAVEQAANSYKALYLYYTDEQVKAIRQGEAWPIDFEPMSPIPAIPKVVHVRSSEWTTIPEAERVYIGRNNRGFKDIGWGNPHKVSDGGYLEAVELYRQEIVRDPVRLKKLDELRGVRVLGCWCKSKGDNGYWPDADNPCHGDVLVNLLAMPEEALNELILIAEEGNIDE